MMTRGLVHRHEDFLIYPPLLISQIILFLDIAVLENIVVLLWCCCYEPLLKG